MKIKLLLSILLLTFVQYVGAITYGLPTSEEDGLHIIHTSDNGFLVSGMADTSGLVVKFNQFLGVEWATTLYYSGSNLEPFIVESPINDGFYVAIQFNTYDSIGTYLEAGSELVKLDNAGNVLWETALHDFHFDTCEGYPIYIGLENDTIVVANQVCKQSGDYVTSLLRCNMQGIQLSIDSVGAQIEEINFSGAGYIFTGQEGLGGAILNNAIYSTGGATYFQLISSAPYDGKILSAGYTWDGASTSEFMLLHSDSNGDSIYSQKSSYFESIGLYALNDNQFYLAGFKDTLGNTIDFISLIDSTGHISWTHFFDPNLYLAELKILDDKSFIVVGDSIDPTTFNYDAWIAVFDSMGNDITYRLINNVEPNPDYSFQLFPNPTKNNLTVALDSKFNFHSNYYYRIIDVTGKIIEQKKMFSQTQIIALDNISNGIYFLEITDNENQFVRKKFILNR